MTTDVESAIDVLDKTPEQITEDELRAKRQVKLQMAGMLVSMARATKDADIQKWASSAVADVVATGGVEDLLANYASQMQSQVQPDPNAQDSRKSQSNENRAMLLKTVQDRNESLAKQRAQQSELTGTVISLISEMMKRNGSRTT